MPAHTKANTAQEARALQLRIAGATYVQIAEALGWRSKSRAYDAVHRALADHGRRDQAAISDYRALQAERLTVLWRAVYARATKPDGDGWDPATVRAGLAILDREARLLGLDAPVRVEVTDSTMREVDDLLGEMTRLVNGGTPPDDLI